MFRKILIANRGEIALRILRTCQEMGIGAVAVHSTADSEAMHVRLADEAVCIGPPSSQDSYLNIPAIIAAAEISGADAIHPGYGFLAENANFATIVAEHGIKFIGPNAAHIKLMGDKIQAKLAAERLKLPILPGSNTALDGPAQAMVIAADIGFPVIIKAAAGGGGRGMKIVHRPEDLEPHYLSAKSETKKFFGDDSLYLEKYLESPRHIEIQILCDGRETAVHLGARDCSIQRRHQKVVEETPPPTVAHDLIEAIGARTASAMLEMGYEGVGTVEFLFKDRCFYFIEMNTRLQVEHPITEEIVGLDLVREQIRVAAGESLGYEQEDVKFSGHAIECRINAEHPTTFAPTPGTIRDYHAPGGPGVRVDSAIYAGYTVPPNYDSLIGKLIITGPSRQECLMRLRRALKEYVIGGIETTLPLHMNLLREEDFLAGKYNINWLEKIIANRQR